MTSTERLLRETLHAPELRVTPGVGLLDRARYEGARLRRRRRRRTAGMSLAAVAVIAAGAAAGPRLLDRPLTAGPTFGSGLRIDPAMTVPSETGDRAPSTRGTSIATTDSHPVLWTERVAGHSMTVVAAYRGGRLCVQPANAADADLRRPACAGRAGKGTGLLALPVGGASGLQQADASVSRVVILADQTVASVVAHLPGGDTYLAYQLGPLGPEQGLLAEVVMPAGQQVLRLDALDGNGRLVGAWTPRG